jgi:hypothetical protein
MTSAVIMIQNIIDRRARWSRMMPLVSSKMDWNTTAVLDGESEGPIKKVGRCDGGWQSWEEEVWMERCLIDYAQNVLGWMDMILTGLNIRHPSFSLCLRQGREENAGVFLDFLRG